MKNEQENFEKLLQSLSQSQDYTTLPNYAQEGIDIITGGQIGNRPANADTVVKDLANVSRYIIPHSYNKSVFSSDGLYHSNSDNKSVFSSDGLYHLIERLFTLFPKKMQGLQVGYNPLDLSIGHSVAILKKPKSDNYVFYDPNDKEGPMEKTLPEIVEAMNGQYFDLRAQNLSETRISYFWSNEKGVNNRDEHELVAAAVNDIAKVQQEEFLEQGGLVRETQHKLWGLPNKHSFNVFPRSFFLSLMDNAEVEVRARKSGQDVDNFMQRTLGSDENLLASIILGLLDPILEKTPLILRAYVAKHLFDILIPSLSQLYKDGYFQGYTKNNLIDSNLKEFKRAFIKSEATKINDKIQNSSDDERIKLVREMLEYLFTFENIQWNDYGAKELLEGLKPDLDFQTKSYIYELAFYAHDKKKFVNDCQAVIEEFFTNRADREFHQSLINDIMSELKKIV